MKIDINCDMGESFGVYGFGYDEEIINYITSVNIACGFHAGDPNIMRKTVALALEKNVAIGAHPGFPDLNGFGRREMNVNPEEVYNLMIYQIGALQAFVKAAGGSLHHVKPHGALYNMAAKDEALALAIVRAIQDIDSSLILYGLANSALTKIGEQYGLDVAYEVFADRTYQENGLLTPRSHQDALITDEEKAISQVLKMIIDGKVMTVQGNEIPIKADTVCIHSDGVSALQFAKRLKETINKF